MACVSADGKLTASGRAILAATAQPVGAADVATLTGLPLFRVRGGLRELAAAGRVTEANGRYVRITDNTTEPSQ